MKNKTIALLAVPVFIAISTFSLANSESANGEGGNKNQKEKHRGGHGSRNSEKMVRMLTEKLALSESQQVAVKALFSKQKQMMESRKESGKALHEAVRNLDVNAGDYSEKLAQVKAQAGLSAELKIDNIMAMKQGMAAILSAEQAQQFEALEMKKKGKSKGGHKQD